MKKTIGAIAVLAALTATADAADGRALAEARQCFSCHAMDRERQAPSFKLVARNYVGIMNADYMLEGRMRLGGVGHWGIKPMPAAGGPRPAVSEAEAQELVAWILALK